jgi:DNA-binding transcriptional LysR family regulator
MQNRRIIDRLFVAGGCNAPKVPVETNSVLSLVAHVRSGDWSSVVPHTFLGLVRHDLPTFAGLRAIPLVAPEAQQAVGLVVSERDPLSPLVRALVEVAQQFDLSGQLESANTNLTEAKG